MAGQGAQLPFHHPEYELISLLGSGASSTVYLARDTGGTQWAIKLIKRGFGMGQDGPKRIEQFQAELLNLKSLMHPYVVGLKEVIVTTHYLGVVQEYVNFGNLRALVQRHGPLGESDARSFFQKLIASVAYCHAKGIANRDIKCENTLLALRDDGHMDVKLCDFGLSKRFTGNTNQAKTLVGSPFYVPPEVIRAGHINLKTQVPTATYDAAKADTWCCGVTLYFALTAHFPHVSLEAQELKEIQQWQVAQKRMLETGDFEERRLAKCTPECVAFLRRLLCTNPATRLGVPDIVADPWLQVDMPADYAELVLTTPLLFEQQTLIRCEQSDEGIRSLCKEAAWLVGEGPTSTYRAVDEEDGGGNDDDWDYANESMVSFAGQQAPVAPEDPAPTNGGAPLHRRTPSADPQPSTPGAQQPSATHGVYAGATGPSSSPRVSGGTPHAGGGGGTRTLQSVGQQLQQMHIREQLQSSAQWPPSERPPSSAGGVPGAAATVSLHPSARQMLLENAALAQHCAVVQGLLLGADEGQLPACGAQLEKTLVAMLECLQRMEHYRQRLQ